MRPTAPFRKLLHGASHERGRRAGTENVPYIVALGHACTLSKQFTSVDAMKALATRRDSLFEKLRMALAAQHNIDVVRHTTGDVYRLLPNTLSVTLRGIDAAPLLHQLRDRVAASAGAACHAGDQVSMSETLRAMQVSESDARCTLRLSLGRDSSEEHIECAVQYICDAIKELTAH